MDLHQRAFADFSVSSWAVGQSAFIAVAELNGRFAGFGLSERVGRPATVEQLLAGPDDGAADWHRQVDVAPEDTLFSAVAVQPHLRRRGVARALCEVRVQEARIHGSIRAFVHCVASTGSVPLYASLGFDPVVTVPAYTRSGLAMTLMARRL